MEEQVCEHEGDISDISDAFAAAPQFANYVNGPFSYALWSTSSAEWVTFYNELKAQGKCSSAAQLGVAVALVLVPALLSLLA